MIEAVFEDPRSRRRSSPRSSRTSPPDALLGSNTSTLPITELAEDVTRPADFIGLHFFSPVDKMPLLEIIKGEQTSDEALYRALDVAKQIKKTPIVVNDSRGFFTSRVIGTFINEGIAMLAEGIPAASIEQASSQAGYPAPVLQLSRRAEPEAHAQDPRRREGGERSRHGWDGHPSRRSSTACSTSSAPGQARGRGLLRVRGRQAHRACGRACGDAFPPVDDPPSISLKDLEERMMFVEAIESVKCLDEGVIETVADANIGSIFGIGFPGWTGGVLQYINGYEGGPAGSSRGPASWPSSTATASSRPLRWSRRPSAARRTSTVPPSIKPRRFRCSVHAAPLRARRAPWASRE